MLLKVSTVDQHGLVKFMVSFCGLSWYTHSQLEEVQYVTRQLKHAYPHLSVF